MRSAHLPCYFNGRDEGISETIALLGGVGPGGRRSSSMTLD